MNAARILRLSAVLSGMSGFAAPAATRKYALCVNKPLAVTTQRILIDFRSIWQPITGSHCGLSNDCQRQREAIGRSESES